MTSFWPDLRSNPENKAIFAILEVVPEKNKNKA